MSITLEKTENTWISPSLEFIEKKYFYPFDKFMFFFVGVIFHEVAHEPYIDSYRTNEFFQLKPVDTRGEIERTLSHVSNLLVDIPDVSDVRNYLIKYPDIIEMLLFVCAITSERFDFDTKISLEVYHDPEIEDEYLTLYVRQQEYDENIMKKIKMIRSMYEDRLVNKNGWLLVTTDFQPPK